MGIREEETGNVVSAPPLIGDQRWLIRLPDGSGFCCLVALSWFAARRLGQKLNGGAPVEVEWISGHCR